VIFFTKWGKKKTRQVVELAANVESIGRGHERSRRNEPPSATSLAFGAAMSTLEVVVASTLYSRTTMAAPSSPRFDHLQATQHQDVLVLTFVDAELATDEVVHGLRVELLSAVNDQAVRKVVLDLRNVRYLGSAALRPFLNLKQKIKDRGGRVLLCGLAPRLAEVLRVTRLIEQDHGLPGLFDSVVDVPAALTKMATEPG
jgi:anti-anti-sigma factor